MYYVLDDNNNKIEAYDKEGFLAFLEQAISKGTLAGIASDSAFVDKLKCCVSGATMKQAFVTQAKYNELAENHNLIANCEYHIIDDTTLDDIDNELKNLNDRMANAETRGIQDIHLDTFTTSSTVDEYKTIAAMPIGKTIDDIFMIGFNMATWSTGPIITYATMKGIYQYVYNENGNHFMCNGTVAANALATAQIYLKVENGYLKLRVLSASYHSLGGENTGITTTDLALNHLVIYFR